MRALRVLMGVCLAAVLVGCSATGESVAPGPPAGAAIEPAGDRPAGQDGSAASDKVADLGGAVRAESPHERAVTPQEPGSAPLPALAPRQVVRQADISLRVDDLTRAAEGVRQVAASHGGYVAAEHASAATATLTLRVAGDRLDAALTALTDLGAVETRSTSTQDVTDQAIDLSARIENQRAGVQRLRALLERAETVGEVVAVESELTARQAELESLQQRAAALDDQVALSTVRVHLQAPDAPASGGSGGFGSGLSAGWQALRVVGLVALTALGAALPFAVLLAVPAVLGLVWYRRRRRETPTAPAAAQDTGGSRESTGG